MAFIASMARRNRAPLASTCVLLLLAAMASALEDVQPSTGRVLLVKSQERAPAIMSAFKEWKAQHGRTYQSEAEEAKALGVFEQNLNIVQKWAAAVEATAPAMSKFADMPWDEFQRVYLSSLANATIPSATTQEQQLAKDAVATTTVTPTSSRRQLLQKFTGPKKVGDVYLNWADVKKYATPVRDQGRCGACWAFAAVQALEYAYSIHLDRNGAIPKGYKASQLSIQQLLDCFTAQQGGCGWGSAAAVYNQLNSQALVPENYYPLVSSKTGVTNACNGGTVSSAVAANQDVQFSPSSIGYVRLEGVGRDALIAQLKQSPLVCHFEVDVQFMLYNAQTTPVYRTGTCSGNNLNHALTIVGYDMRTNPPSWIAKNSWGKNWGGLKGYVRIAMTDGNQGTCGMYKWCFRPDNSFSGGSAVVQTADSSDGVFGGN